MKKTLMIIAFFVFCFCGGIGTGYIINANNVKEEAMALYQAILVNLEEKYLEETEIKEYKAMLEQKEQAFVDKNIEKLKEIQQKILALQGKIQQRKVVEEQMYAEKRASVEGMNTPDGATDEERSSVDALKNAILESINQKEKIEIIDSKITELQQLITTIQEAIEQRTLAAGRQAETTPPVVTTDETEEIDEGVEI